MSKKSKNRYITYTPEELYGKTKHLLMNKYFNTFLNTREWDGIEPETEDYIMRKFWSEGKICAFNLPYADELVFAPFSSQDFRLYDVPNKLNIINERQTPGFPTTTLTNNKDAVIGYYQRNHKPVAEFVEFYVEKMAQIDLVMNTNLYAHQVPFLLGVSKDSGDPATMNSIVNKILAGELVIFADLEELGRVQNFVTSVPYILDKLFALRNNYECELLTFLGVDNSQLDVDKLAVDQINANNQIINANNEAYDRELKKFCKKIKEVLNKEVNVKSTLKPVASVHQDSDTHHPTAPDKATNGGTEVGK